MVPTLNGSEFPFGSPVFSWVSRAPRSNFLDPLAGGKNVFHKIIHGSVTHSFWI